MGFLLRSGTEVNTPRAITSRSILANHSSTWLSHDTVMCEMSPPSSAASLRVDQCVEPSAGLCLVVRANTRASRRSGTLLRLRPAWRKNKACQTVCGKPLAPESNVAVIAIELGPDGAPGQSLGKPQDQTRTTRQIRSNGPSIG